MEVIAQKATTHIRGKVFPVQQVLAVARTNADGPGLLLPHDLSSKLPDLQPERNAIENRVRRHDARSGIPEVIVQDFPVSLAHWIVGRRQHSRTRDDQRRQPRKPPRLQPHPAPALQIDQEYYRLERQQQFRSKQDQHHSEEDRQDSPPFPFSFLAQQKEQCHDHIPGKENRIDADHFRECMIKEHLPRPRLNEPPCRYAQTEQTARRQQPAITPKELSPLRPPDCNTAAKEKGNRHQRRFAFDMLPGRKKIMSV